MSVHPYQYALPAIKVVEEVRPAVLVPILPKCNPSRVLVNSLVPITSLDREVLVEDEKQIAKKREEHPKDEEVTATIASCSSSSIASSQLNMCLNSAIERHQRVILSQGGLQHGLPPHAVKAAIGKMGSTILKPREGGGQTGKKREREGPGDGSSEDHCFLPTTAGDRDEGLPNPLQNFFTFDASNNTSSASCCSSSHLFGDSALDMAPLTNSAASPLAMVEWANGDVSCTHDTRGLGEEERTRLRFTLNLRRHPLVQRCEDRNGIAIDGRGEETVHDDFYSSSSLPLPPLHRENVPSDIAAEQLLRIQHCDVIRRHAGIGLGGEGGDDDDEAASKGMHCTLPPQYAYALFPPTLAVSAAPLSPPPPIPIASLAAALVRNYDAVESCRMTQQVIPPVIVAGRAVGGGGGHQLGRGVDETYDARLLYIKSNEKGKQKGGIKKKRSGGDAGAADDNEDDNHQHEHADNAHDKGSRLPSIKCVIAKLLKSSSIGRTYVKACKRSREARRRQQQADEKEGADENQDQGGGCTNCCVNDDGLDHLFSLPHRRVCEAFDIAFYEHRARDDAMGLFTFTLGHTLRPYGHTTAPFRLLSGVFEAQVKDMLKLLLRYGDRQHPPPPPLPQGWRHVYGRDGNDNDSGASDARAQYEIAAVQAVATIVHFATLLIRDHLNCLTKAITNALFVYAAEAAHRYVVVSVRNRNQRVRKEGLSAEVTEALDYLYYRVPHTDLAEAAIKRLLLHPMALNDGFLLSTSSSFWEAFEEKEKLVMGRQCVHLTEAAVRQCRKEIERMGRTHSWEEVNGAFYHRC